MKVLAGFVPYDAHRATMIGYAVEAKPVPGIGRYEWIDFQHVVGAGDDTREAADD